jgi:hypothetical protein
MGRYFEDAKTLYNEALRELERWQQTQDLTTLRDAAEKAWGAVTQASNEVIDAYGRVVPSGTGARRQELARLERQHRQLRSLGLQGTFSTAELVLHRDCFYDGNCPLPYVVDTLVQDVKEFLDAVEQVTQRPRR